MSDSLNINELNDDCLKLIFSLFDLTEKFILECVCLRWQRIICQLLNSQKVLKVGLRSSSRDCYTCMDIYYPIHQCLPIKKSNDWIDEPVVRNEDLCSVLIRCPNIEYLYVCDCTITAPTLEWLVSQLSRIKCLSLIAIQGLNSWEWDRVWSALAEHQLTHFTLSDNHLADIEISKLIETNRCLTELHLAYYRHPLTHLFCYLNEKLSKLSLIECLRTNLDALKGLVYGKASNVTDLVIFKVPTYDENILSEFIGIKMSRLKRFAYCFDSPIPYIQPIECLQELRHLALMSNDEYGFDLSSIFTNTMKNITHLQLNTHFDAYMLRNLEDIFPNVETLEISFDRICCSCDPNAELNNVQNNQNLGNELNNNSNNNHQNQNVDQNANQIQENPNNEQNQNANLAFGDVLDDDEPYMDDNCNECSEKIVLIISKLNRLKCLKMNGLRIKESALKAIVFCEKLQTIIIDSNVQELNLKLLLISCLNLAMKDKKRVICLRLDDKLLTRIRNVNNWPKNLFLQSI